jgi:hypothetical protein
MRKPYKILAGKSERRISGHRWELITLRMWTEFVFFRIDKSGWFV